MGLPARLVLLAFALAPCPPAAAQAKEPPVLAFATRVDGAARLDRAAGTQALGLLDALHAGECIGLAPAATAEIVLLAGPPRVFILEGPGRFRLQPAGPRALEEGARVRVRDLQSPWRDLRLDASGVARASAALRAVPRAALQLLGPAGVTRGQDALALRWRQPHGPEGTSWQYRVRLFDNAGSVLLDRGLADAPAEAADPRLRTLPLPEGLLLARGSTYLWSVEATAVEDARREQASVEFALLPLATEERLAALLAAPPPGTAESVLAALALAQAGLREDARAQWQRAFPAALSPAVRP